VQQIEIKRKQVQNKFLFDWSMKKKRINVVYRLTTSVGIKVKDDVIDLTEVQMIILNV
jgi:hypothetical protein